ncbi:MAG TPA: MgtC/SapB family protein [Methylomirabilota bacterium]|nr:MgtC/SapB family protein [Methylomirabilota bacterium]
MNETLTISELEIAVRLGVATLLGALVGLERERLERAAGLRTHAIVAVASALIMIVSAYGFPNPVSDDRVLVTLDPSRVAAQVVSGIGFLGAGLIVFRKNAVRGLTTAASIWAVSGIGLAAGGGLYEAAALGTGFILAIQAGLRPIVHRFFSHHQDHRLELRVAPATQCLVAIERAVNAAGAEIRRLSLRPVRDGAEDRVDVALSSVKAVPITRLLETLRGIDGVRAVAYAGSAGRAAEADGDESDDEDDGDVERR